MLAHEWLTADKPQILELSAGRRIGDSLITTIERRVAQLRRADDLGVWPHVPCSRAPGN